MSLLIQKERRASGVCRITEGVCMIQGIDHIAIIVSTENSILFYEKLGFAVIHK